MLSEKMFASTGTNVWDLSCEGKGNFQDKQGAQHCVIILIEYLRETRLIAYCPAGENVDVNKTDETGLCNNRGTDLF